MFDVITVGSATIDVFMDTKAKEEKGKIEYPAGAKIMVKDMDFKTGGCGMNVAMALKKLGCKAAFLGKLGNDINSKIIRERLRERGIKFLGSHGEGNSGYSMVLDSVKHDRTILHYRGANDFLRPRDVKKSKLKTRWLFFASAEGYTFDTERMLADFAKKNGISIAYNPGITECRMGHKHIGGILKAVELLIINMDEAAILSGKGSPANIIKSLRAMGPRIVCITNGSEKMFCSDGNFIYELSPHKIEVVESTGAGDAFSSGMLAGMVKGRNVEESMQTGMANAEFAIRGCGATENLLTWSEAKWRIARNPGKMRKRKV